MKNLDSLRLHYFLKGYKLAALRIKKEDYNLIRSIPWYKVSEILFSYVSDNSDMKNSSIALIETQKARKMIDYISKNQAEFSYLVSNAEQKDAKYFIVERN